MKYFWSTSFNSGEFTFWKANDDVEAKKMMVKKYCGKPFDWGETSESAYLRYERKGN